jgi:DeoR/GlpR family transcriptional regulator of sugar metabolism
MRPEYAKIITYVTEHGSISDKEYSEFSNRANSTRALDFKHMVEQGLFERFGNGKNTFYRLNK